uniref:Uncharacterized protein n=1 Tax=Timema bartmani TaxID=61472 RepID=A0A7R9F1C2_9NEOP|nr:unnamed protein product [Timema bartmani]
MIPSPDYLRNNNAGNNNNILSAALQPYKNRDERSTKKFYEQPLERASEDLMEAVEDGGGVKGWRKRGRNGEEEEAATVESKRRRTNDNTEDEEEGLTSPGVTSQSNFHGEGERENQGGNGSSVLQHHPSQQYLDCARDLRVPQHRFQDLEGVHASQYEQVDASLSEGDNTAEVSSQELNHHHHSLREGEETEDFHHPHDQPPSSLPVVDQISGHDNNDMPYSPALCSQAGLLEDLRMRSIDESVENDGDHQNLILQNHGSYSHHNQGMRLRQSDPFPFGNLFPHLTKNDGHYASQLNFVLQQHHQQQHDHHSNAQQKDRHHVNGIDDVINATLKHEDVDEDPSDDAHQYLVHGSLGAHQHSQQESDYLDHHHQQQHTVLQQYNRESSLSSGESPDVSRHGGSASPDEQESVLGQYHRDLLVGGKTQVERKLLGNLGGGGVAANSYTHLTTLQPPPSSPLEQGVLHQLSPTGAEESADQQHHHLHQNRDMYAATSSASGMDHHHHLSGLHNQVGAFHHDAAVSANSTSLLHSTLNNSMYSRSSMYPTNIQYLNNSPNSDVSGQTTASHNIWSSQVSLGSEDAYTSTGAKTVSSTLPGFSQRYSSGGGGGGSGVATLQGFTSPHRSSPYSPTPAPAHASTLSGYSEAGNGAALWGNYDPSLQQYGVVTSANSSGTRGRTTSVASLSAAASLSAISLGSEDAYTSTGAKTVSSTLPGFSQRYSSGGGGGGSGVATLQGFTSPHRSSPYSPTPAPAHASTLSGYSEAGNGAALWGNYDPSLQQYGVVTSANSSGTRGRTTSVASLSAAASLSAIHPTEIRTSISPSSAVELNMTSALANYATEYVTDRVVYSYSSGYEAAEYKDESQNKKSPKLFTRVEREREREFPCETSFVYIRTQMF